jgi:hypothetical protein
MQRRKELIFVLTKWFLRDFASWRLCVSFFTISENHKNQRHLCTTNFKWIRISPCSLSPRLPISVSLHSILSPSFSHFFAWPERQRQCAQLRLSDECHKSAASLTRRSSQLVFSSRLCAQQFLIRCAQNLFVSALFDRYELLFSGGNDRDAESDSDFACDQSLIRFFCSIRRVAANSYTPISYRKRISWYFYNKYALTFSSK